MKRIDFDEWFLKLPETEPDEELDNPEGYLDKTNVVMVIPKNKAIKHFIKSNFDVNTAKLPSNLLNKDKLTSDSVYSMNYLLTILKKMNEYSDKVRIRSGKDYPLIIENEHLTFILAPRVENDPPIKFEELKAYKNYLAEQDKKAEQDKELKERLSEIKKINDLLHTNYKLEDYDEVKHTINDLARGFNQDD
jgi:hypothetical protein